MGHIHTLSPELAHKIAAGEVIERPANIVKELLENSIDAGATAITIRIEKAGTQLIEISDNGCGMDRDDAQACFSRHATSKLHAVDELMHLDSFGFRGEALASVAAVSKVTLHTKPQNSDEPLGTTIHISDSNISAVEDYAGAAGTTIRIAELFYNVPVRKKFLKQDETEWNQIQQIVWGLCVTHQNVSCKLYRDGKLVLNAPAVSSLKDRLTQVWGHNISANLVNLSPPPKESKHGITITGMSSNPNFWRYGRHNLFFFVNDRLVKNNELSKAVMKGYRNVLPPGRFPAACLFITLDKEKVDVNIHPRKEEVRFTHQQAVATQLAQQVTRTLEEYVSGMLSGRGTRTAVDPRSSPANMQLLDPGSSPGSAQTISQPQELQTIPRPQSRGPEIPPPPVFSALTPEKNPLSQPVSKQSNVLHKTLNDGLSPGSSTPLHAQQPAVDTATPPRIIGQLFATYIVMESSDDDTVIIVDQHAAHERILYHQFAHKFTNKEGTRLLFPELITLAPAALKAILAHKTFFDAQGIELEQGGPDQLAVLSTPPRIQKESLREFIRDCADFIVQHDSLDTEAFAKQLNEHVHSHMACKAAIRAGDVLDVERMQEVVTQLLATPNRFICVHGRPTMWTMTRSELAKKFRRP
ncbi:MAG: DNA mismatch repair endonuclease MutL [Candidatus Dependentiae bacterium]|jgi:DNA mismatch repair protein MutL